ncbi:ATP-binding protein, partial [Streptomyces erythrochromogenes]
MTTTGTVDAVPAQRRGPRERRRAADGGLGLVRDLRGPALRGPRRLGFAEGDKGGVYGLPGGGTTT